MRSQRSTSLLAALLALACLASPSSAQLGGTATFSLLGDWATTLRVGDGSDQTFVYTFGSPDTLRQSVRDAAGRSLGTQDAKYRRDATRLTVTWADGAIEKADLRFVDAATFTYRIESHTGDPGQVGLVATFRRAGRPTPAGPAARSAGGCCLSVPGGPGGPPPGLSRTCGNPTFDSIVGDFLQSIVNAFGVAPELYFCDDGASPNAFATPSTGPLGPHPGRDGAVVLGRRLMAEELMHQPGIGGGQFRKFNPSFNSVLAHEVAHTLQFRNQEPTVGRDRELHADYLAGWYLGKIVRADQGQIFDTVQPLLSFWRKGDYLFNDPSHHGTPEQRLAAFKAGMDDQTTQAERAYADASSYIREMSPAGTARPWPFAPAGPSAAPALPAPPINNPAPPAGPFGNSARQAVRLPNGKEIVVDFGLLADYFDISGLAFEERTERLANTRMERVRRLAFDVTAKNAIDAVIGTQWCKFYDEGGYMLNVPLAHVADMRRNVVGSVRVSAGTKVRYQIDLRQTTPATIRVVKDVLEPSP